jgi:hypothetical protein
MTGCRFSKVASLLSTHKTNVRKNRSTHRIVFLSYASADGKEYAYSLHRRLEEEYKLDVWQDIVDLEAGENIWQQIEEALNKVNFLVLVLTQGAERSENVAKELSLARQNGVCVLPIISHPKPDFNKMPRWLSQIELTDPEISPRWESFIARLMSDCHALRVHFMRDGLPDNFVCRSKEFNYLLNLLLDETTRDPVTLRSFGGYGKTVLASAVCNDPNVKNAFSDGILWVKLGAY